MDKDIAKKAKSKALDKVKKGGRDIAKKVASLREYEKSGHSGYWQRVGIQRDIDKARSEKKGTKFDPAAYGDMSRHRPYFNK